MIILKVYMLACHAVYGTGLRVFLIMKGQEGDDKLTPCNLTTL